MKFFCDAFYPYFGFGHFHLYMSICVCVNRIIDGDLPWCLMEAVTGQTGIAVFCIQHIIQVYLKKITIRIIISRIY